MRSCAMPERLTEFVVALAMSLVLFVILAAFAVTLYALGSYYHVLPF